ncbi:MAG: tRNA (adenosine(37)-N6)-threonylcarbamoyltransferase complex dimerization subunit type 1 TsaB [Desulfobulbaceae bacterium A2]|nr:MAG: tRNA (adenosine(37)-N6)-threonylcarbamoyltransferase complex dimerization subunit type 1 TsaB [Desulfobulbaceae bacterium A2]
MAGPALTLALETATSRSSVALTRGSLADGALVAEWSLERGRQQQRSLLGTAERLLRQSGHAWSDLTLLAVSLGPGSFTGLRIGLAAAQGLALGLNLPLVGVSTLEALACAGAGEGEVCCLLDARRGQLYAGCYRLAPGCRPQVVLEPRACPPATLATWLRQRHPLPPAVGGLPGERDTMLLLGDGAEAYRAQFADIAGLHWAAPLQARPRAAAVGLLAASIQAAGPLPSALGLAPLYLRPAEAEETLTRHRDAAAGEHQSAQEYYR